MQVLVSFNIVNLFIVVIHNGYSDTKAYQVAAWNHFDRPFIYDSKNFELTHIETHRKKNKKTIFWMGETMNAEIVSLTPLGMNLFFWVHSSSR